MGGWAVSGVSLPDSNRWIVMSLGGIVNAGSQACAGLGSACREPATGFVH